MGGRRDSSTVARVARSFLAPRHPAGIEPREMFRGRAIVLVRGDIQKAWDRRPLDRRRIASVAKSPKDIDSWLLASVGSDEPEGPLTDCGGEGRAIEQRRIVV